MFSESNNFNQQYIPGQVHACFKLESCQLYQHGGYNPEYVAGVPYMGSNQSAQQQNYPQQPVAPMIVADSYDQSVYVTQGVLGFDGLNQQVNQNYPGFNVSYQASQNISVPAELRNGINDFQDHIKPFDQNPDISLHGFSNEPVNLHHNIEGFDGSNQKMDQNQNYPGFDVSYQGSGHIQVLTEFNDEANDFDDHNEPILPHPNKSSSSSSDEEVNQYHNLDDRDDSKEPKYKDHEEDMFTDQHQNIVQEMSTEGHKGTIKPHNNFNAEVDCNILRKAMKGIGTDEKAIIECLGRRNLEQRLEIKKTYKTMFGKDLIDSLKSEISGNFCRAVIESLYDSDYYDAYSLHKAMEGAGTREDVLTEILTSRSNKEIENIKVIYQKFFKKQLEKEIASETSGFYKRVLISCLQANKPELSSEDYQKLRQHGASAVVNINLANQEAAELYNAGEKKLGTDEATFIKVFASRNKFQLRATFNAYEKISGHNILKAIESEMSGDLASALKAIALMNMNEPLYFTTRLYKSMKGAGTIDTALIRIILSRSEIDLENIKKEFQKQYNQTLEAFVKDDISGDYFKYLMRFIEGN